MDLPVAQIMKYLPAIQETWIWSLGWEDSLEKGMTTTPVCLPGEFHGQRSLVGYSPWGHKEWDTTERLTLSKVSDKIINFKIILFSFLNGNFLSLFSYMLSFFFSPVIKGYISVPLLPFDRSITRNILFSFLQTLVLLDVYLLLQNVY